MQGLCTLCWRPRLRAYSQLCQQAMTGSAWAARLRQTMAQWSRRRRARRQGWHAELPCRKEHGELRVGAIDCLCTLAPQLRQGWMPLPVLSNGCRCRVF